MIMISVGHCISIMNTLQESVRKCVKGVFGLPLARSSPASEGMQGPIDLQLAEGHIA